MSYRICRKTTSTTFRVNGQLCKLFLEPMHETGNGSWLWNVGFAIGKSRRQLNDWYWRKKNKRARSVKKKFLGKSGLKAIAEAFDQLLLLRWHIPPGDALLLDCTSGDPERQFRAWQRWQRKHPDIIIDHEGKNFFWFRPPYPDDAVYQDFKVISQLPSDRRICWGLDKGYLQSFGTLPKDHGKQ